VITLEYKLIAGEYHAAGSTHVLPHEEKKEKKKKKRGK
jgi:hypothetical protein